MLSQLSLSLISSDKLPCLAHNLNRTKDQRLFSKTVLPGSRSVFEYLFLSTLNFIIIFYNACNCVSKLELMSVLSKCHLTTVCQTAGYLNNDLKCALFYEFLKLIL